MKYSLLLSTALASVLLPVGVWAVTYPISTPAGETPGGTFQTYFDNMYLTTQCDSIGQVVGGFTSAGVPICVIPSSAGLSLTGALGYTIYHNGITWVSSPNIYNANGNVGIGTSTPGAKLEVNGQVKITGGSPGNNKVLLSDSFGLATWSNVPMPCVPGGSGISNTCYGIGALTSNTTGFFNTANGETSLYSNTTGYQNSAFGIIALYGNTTGYQNSAYSMHSLYNNNTGYHNSAFGMQSLFSNTSGYDNSAFGMQSLFGNTTGQQNTALGYSAGSNLTTGNSNIFIGYNVQPNIGNTASNQLNIGNWIYGNAGNIGIGATNPTARLEVNGQIRITGGSPGVGRVLTSDATGLATWSSSAPNPCTPGGTATYSTCYGFQALLSNTTGDYNTANGYTSLMNNTTGNYNAGFGYGTLFANTTGGYNTALGFQAMSSNTTASYASAVGYRALMQNAGTANSALGSEALTSNTTGGYNTAVGHYSMFSNTTGGYNTALGVYSMNNNTLGERNAANGYGSLYSNISGSYNTALGFWSSFSNTTGSDNVALGYTALRNNTSGNSNTALGDAAGYNLTSGNNNIFLGYNVQPNIANTGSNQLNIGNWIYGNAGNIGIGVTNPTARLEINGQVKITGGSPGSGKVLTSDTNGLAVWSNSLSGATAGTIIGGVQNYVPKFGTGGTGLFSSQIFDNGTGVGIGTGSDLSTRVVIDSGINNDSGLRLARINPSSPLTSNGVIALGVNASGKVLPISPISNIAVYTGVLRTTTLSPNPDLNTFEVTYDFNKYFDIPGKQSFVVSKGDGPSYNGPYFRENGTSSLCSWNGGFGTSPYDCATNGPDGLSASPWNSFTMTAKGETFGYQIALGARGDAPLFARSGRYNGSVSNGLYTNDSPYQTPAPWQKVLSVPANKPEYLYINTGLNSQLQAISGGGNVGIGTTSPQSRFEIWTGATTTVLQHFRGTNVGLGLGAVRVLTTGTANAGFGNNALRSLTTGYNNSSFGDSALYGNTTGYFNTAGGSQALYGNAGGNWNTALGTQASWSNLGGSYNVAFGGQALYTNSANSDNVAIGYQSLRLATSDDNVAIGSNAGSNLTTGASNIFIGANVQPNIGNTTSNQLNIGNWIYGNNGNIGIGTVSPVSRLDVGGTFELGTNGTQLNAIIKSSVTLDVPSIAASACSAQTFSIANVAVGGSVAISPASALTDRMIIAYARVSAAGTVEAKFCNESAAAINLASMQYHITVIQ